MERAVLIFWGLWLLLNLVAAVRVFAYLVARRRQDKRWQPAPEDRKKAVVIIPVKGFDLQSTPTFFDIVFDQDYSSYRVIVAFDSWDDPVAAWLAEEFEVSQADPCWKHPSPDSTLREVILVGAGPARDEGQKVCNQRAAFDHLADEDEIVVFADSDICLGRDWLARLTAPINCSTHALSTTYRWLVPKRPTLPNQLASVINGSITTQGGWELSNVLWGGSMAIDRAVFDELDIPELIAGSLNDDLRISKEARKAGNRIGFVRSLVLPTTVDFDWGGFLEFAKRQYTQVKFFSPILYTGANFLLGFYALGLGSIIAALVYGYFFAWIPLAAVYVIDQFRGLARQQVYLSLFRDESIRRKLFSTCWLEQMLTPAWMLLHWMIVVSTWTQSRIEWAGIRYRILSKSRTRVLERTAEPKSLPVGVPGLAVLASLHDLGRTTGPIRPRATPTEPIAPATVTATEETSVEPTESSGVATEIEKETTSSEAAPSETASAAATSPESRSGEDSSAGAEIEPSAPRDLPDAEAAPEWVRPEDRTPTTPSTPLRHPGISRSVTALSARPIVSRRKKRRPKAKRPRSRWVRGRLLQGIAAAAPGIALRSDLSSRAGAVRPSPSREERPAAGSKAPEKASPRRRSVAQLSAAERRIASHSAASSPTLGIRHRSPVPSPARPRGAARSRVDQALEKTSVRTGRRFPTRPSSGPSSIRPTSSPSATVSKPASAVDGTTPVGAPKASRSQRSGTAPTAARRPNRRGRTMGSAKTSRSGASGRTNLVSRTRRGGRSRPVSRGPSGRSA